MLTPLCYKLLISIINYTTILQNVSLATIFRGTYEGREDGINILRLGLRWSFTKQKVEKVSFVLIHFFFLCSSVLG